MRIPWIMQYRLGTQVAGGYRVTALLVQVDKDNVPVYQVLKVEPL